MIAIVTDRPNVGREIARVLGAGRKENGYMTGNGYMVTWKMCIRDRAPRIPAEVYGHVFTAQEKANLQDGKTLLVEGLKNNGQTLSLIHICYTLAVFFTDDKYRISLSVDA